MSSKSLPSSFKQNYKYHRNNSSTISTRGKSFSGSSGDSEINKEIINNSSSLSSSVKKSSPLTKPWFNPKTILNDSSTTSNKSWMSRRWSTVSGSLIVRRKHKKFTATRLWLNRQKRRTYPPSTDILKQEQKRFSINGSSTTIMPIFKKTQSRQSLADILTTFYRHGNTSSSVSPTSSSSVSKRIGKILKKKGKQPYRKKVSPQLHVDTHYTEEELKSAVMSMFQPPPTISSKSSTPSSPLKFPTPPKRFSAFYVDLTGKKGKVDYKRPKSRSQYFLGLIQHGVPHKLNTETPAPIITNNDNNKETNYIDQPQQPYCINKYNTQLSIDATLFLFGFIFFPFWWFGAWLHFCRRRSSKSREEEVEEKLYCYDNDLFSIQTFAYLNSIFSFMSLLLIIIIISLIIWLVKS